MNRLLNEIEGLNPRLEERKMPFSAASMISAHDRESFETSQTIMRMIDLLILFSFFVTSTAFGLE